MTVTNAVSLAKLNCAATMNAGLNSCVVRNVKPAGLDLCANPNLVNNSHAQCNNRHL